MSFIIKSFKKIIIVIYLFIKSCVAHFKSGNMDKILIIEYGHLGDAIVNSGAILAIKKYYEERNKKVCLLCSPSVWRLLSMIPGFHNIEVITMSYSDLEYSLSIFRTIFKQSEIKEGYSKVILLSPVMNVDFFLCAAIPGKKYALLYPFYFWGIRKVFFYLFKIFYQDTLFAEANQKRFDLLEVFLKQIGINDYVSKITIIPKQAVSLKLEVPFISIIVDSAISERRWPAEYYLQLIILLLNRYNFDLCLLGSSSDPSLADLLSSVPDHYKKRIHNFVGETSLEEWVEYIRKSEFIVGVDSGSIHIAASVGTMAFCLSGFWVINVFVPYPEEVVHNGTLAPICIYREDAKLLHCSNCRWKTGKYGKLDSECYKKCKSNQPCLCMTKISPEQVFQVIESSLMK